MITRKLTIPMFPLNLILFPGETTKLYIFEERYKQLVEDCMDNDASFGIPYIEKGIVQKYGSEVKINRVLKTYENGGMDILVEATGIFRLHDFSEVLRPKLYGAGVIEYLDITEKIQLSNLQDCVVNYFGIAQHRLLDYEMAKKLTVYNVAASIQLTQSEKYRFVSSSNKQLHLLSVMRFIIFVINAEHQIEGKFIDN